MSITEQELEKLNNIIQILQDDPAAVHTSSDVAKLADLSLVRLKQIFKEHTGSTIQQFLNTAKMKKAATLLAQNIAIKEISISLGYSDLTSFYRTFTKYYNCTPSQYRKQKAQ